MAKKGQRARRLYRCLWWGEVRGWPNGISLENEVKCYNEHGRSAKPQNPTAGKGPADTAQPLALQNNQQQEQESPKVKQVAILVNSALLLAFAFVVYRLIR